MFLTNSIPFTKVTRSQLCCMGIVRTFQCLIHKRSRDRHWKLLSRPSFAHVSSFISCLHLFLIPPSFLLTFSLFFSTHVPRLIPLRSKETFHPNSFHLCFECTSIRLIPSLSLRLTNDHKYAAWNSQSFYDFSSTTTPLKRRWTKAVRSLIFKNLSVGAQKDKDLITPAYQDKIAITIVHGEGERRRTRLGIFVGKLLSDYRSGEGLFASFLMLC